MPALPTSNRFLHNSAGAIDIPIVHEKKIQQNLWKQRNKSDVYDFMRTNDRRKLAVKHQPTVTFDIDELPNESPRIGRQKGAL